MCGVIFGNAFIPHMCAKFAIFRPCPDCRWFGALIFGSETWLIWRKIQRSTFRSLGIQAIPL